MIIIITLIILVMGRSLGSASAAHIINNRIDGVDGCVIESGFATEYPVIIINEYRSRI